MLVVSLLARTYIVDHEIEENSELVDAQIANISQNVKYQFDVIAAKTKAMEAYIKSDGSTDSDKLRKFSEPLLSASTALLDLQFAPDGIVRFVANPELNRVMVGSKLASLKQLSIPAEQSILRKKPAITTFRLNNGRQTLALIHPVFVQQGDDFWGYVVAIIDPERLLSNAGIDPSERAKEFAIGQVTSGYSGYVYLYGNEEVMRRGTHFEDIDLDGSAWRIWYEPNNDILLAQKQASWFIVGMGFIASLIAGVIVYNLMRWPQRMQSNLEAANTKARVSQSRFEDFARASSDWIWETDADGRFTYFSENMAQVIGRKT
jgi:sensor domain CHASE-containing protein